MKPVVLQDVSKPGTPPSDIQTMRRRERKYMEDGIVRAGYAADRRTVVNLLNAALATEIACVLRYKRHYFNAANAAPVAAEFREDANKDMTHITRSGANVIQLRDEPKFSRDGQAKYVRGVTRRAMKQLREMIKEDVIGERITIERYRETFSYRVEQDPTAHVLDGIRASDAERAEHVSSSLESPED
jgi:bacterioferritin